MRTRKYELFYNQKWFKKSCLPIPKVSEKLAYLILEKQRFHCKKCCSSFTAETPVVERNCYFSQNTRLAVLNKSIDILSQKSVAESCHVSNSTVTRIINKAAFETALKNIEINSVAPKLQTVVKTLRKYNKLIENTFEYSNLTNGPLEGINTKIKLIQRISFGYRNFGDLRSRIILSTNLFAANPKKRASNFMLLNLCALAHQSYLTESPKKRAVF